MFQTSLFCNASYSWWRNQRIEINGNLYLVRYFWDNLDSRLNWLRIKDNLTRNCSIKTTFDVCNDGMSLVYRTDFMHSLNFYANYICWWHFWHVKSEIAFSFETSNTIVLFYAFLPLFLIRTNRFWLIFLRKYFCKISHSIIIPTW